MHWILDFDDTLVVGPNTWAIEKALPTFIEEYQLPYQAEQFGAVLLEAQRQGAQDDKGDDEVLNFVFATLNWPDNLKDELTDRVFKQYVPALFPDTLAFLEQLKAADQRLYIVSNNNYAPMLAEQLGIHAYFEAIYTPKQSQARPKPHRGMWEALQQTHSLETGAVVQIVGDDPWSDGQFALTCGADCWIIDRLERYQQLHTTMPFQWVTSLLHIQFKGKSL